MSTRIRMNFNLNQNQRNLQIVNPIQIQIKNSMITMGYTKPRICTKLRVVGNKNCSSCNSSKPKPKPTQP